MTKQEEGYLVCAKHRAVGLQCVQHEHKYDLKDRGQTGGHGRSVSREKAGKGGVKERGIRNECREKRRTGHRERQGVGRTGVAGGRVGFYRSHSPPPARLRSCRGSHL